MKRLKFVLVFVISLFTNTVFAQGAYLDFNAGYGFSISSQNLVNFYNSTEIADSYNAEQVDISLGKGINAGATFGYMFNKNIGAELGISYLFGSETNAKNKYLDATTDYAISAKMLRFSPAIIISAGLEVLNPYAKFGLVMGMGSMNYEFKNADINVITQNIKFDGGLAWGLSAGVGVLYNLNENMALFGEINMINMSYAPTKGEITEATLNGIDQLPSYSTREREIEFVDSYSGDFNNPALDSEPSRGLKQKFPFSSVGINFGMRINL